MFTTLFAAASAPATFEWSPKCAVVMIACNVFAYAIARATIRKPNEGFEIPNSKFFGGLSHASVVGANCLCLLYTSPSPRDLSTSRMPSSA